MRALMGFSESGSKRTSPKNAVTSQFDPNRRSDRLSRTFKRRCSERHGGADVALVAT